VAEVVRNFPGDDGGASVGRAFRFRDHGAGDVASEKQVRDEKEMKKHT